MKIGDKIFLFEGGKILKTRQLFFRANENERICRGANFTVEAKNHYDIPHLYFNQYFET